MPTIIEKQGHYYFELALKDGKTEDCPFCMLNHKHGKINGHRIAHCNQQSAIKQIKTRQYIAPNGQIMSYRDGYFIKVTE